MMISNILATDMKEHFSLMGHFESKLKKDNYDYPKFCNKKF